MLLQSNGPCASCGEAEKDLAHLNAPDVMRAYYADFAKIRSQLGWSPKRSLRETLARTLAYYRQHLNAYL